MGQVDRAGHVRAGRAAVVFERHIAVDDRDIGIAAHLQRVVVDDVAADGPGDLRVRASGEGEAVRALISGDATARRLSER